MADIVRNHLVDVDKLYDEVETVVESLQRQYCPPCKFIIGITRDPVHRYSNSAYGYKSGRMFILHRATGPTSAGELEKMLIARFKGCKECCNRKPGGEGISMSSRSSAMGLDFVYTYVVFSEQLMPEVNSHPDAYQRLSEIPWSRARQK